VFERHGVSPANLELEITETTLMANPKRTIGMLKELAELGVHLAIDDFGTGYSSLSALQQFPIGTLKIDQSFVRDVPLNGNDSEIIRAIIAMANSLGLQIIAEGVERSEQLDFLRAENCHLYQGYLFSEPLSSEQFRSLLSARR